ncbi:nucleoside/nucleotide kinase family protein [soil metagenome]
MDAALAARAIAVQQRAGGRVVIGITGSPGAGKSTIAAELCDALGARAALVPMDGFHLANRVLTELGRGERKGAPDTFDVGGYVALLQRLRDPGTETVYAPAYERSIEEPIANAIPVAPSVDIVVTEGNYLLYGSGGWERVRPLLDAAWFVGLEHGIRLERLVARHRAVGKSPADALAWSHGPDEANASLIEPTRALADLVIGNP